MPQLGNKRPVTALESSKDTPPSKRPRKSTNASHPGQGQNGMGGGGSGASSTSSVSSEIESRAHLCEPWNMNHFFERIKSFSSVNWFCKPETVAPMICSRYGWSCTAKDTISCAVCREVLTLSYNVSTSQSAVDSLVEKFNERVTVSGHLKQCPWRSNPCPMNFLQLPNDMQLRISFRENLVSFQQHTKQQATTNHNSTTVHKETTYFVPKVSPKQKELILSEAKNCSKVTDSDDRKRELVEPSDAMIIAACGWSVNGVCHETNNTNPNNCHNFSPLTSFMECKYCNRRVGINAQQYTQVPHVVPDLHHAETEDETENAAEASDELKMSELNTTSSAPNNSNFLHDKITSPRVLAERLGQLGIKLKNTKRSQHLQLYPTMRLQSDPTFVSQRSLSTGSTSSFDTPMTRAASVAAKQASSGLPPFAPTSQKQERATSGFSVPRVTTAGFGRAVSLPESAAPFWPKKSLLYSNPTPKVENEFPPPLPLTAEAVPYTQTSAAQNALVRKPVSDVSDSGTPPLGRESQHEQQQRGATQSGSGRKKRRRSPSPILEHDPSRDSGAENDSNSGNMPTSKRQRKNKKIEMNPATSDHSVASSNLDTESVQSTSRRKRTHHEATNEGTESDMDIKVKRRRVSPETPVVNSNAASVNTNNTAVENGVNIPKPKSGRKRSIRDTDIDSDMKDESVSRAMSNGTGVGATEHESESRKRHASLTLMQHATDKYFDPIGEHRSPCPYVSPALVNGQQVSGWVVSVQKMDRDANVLRRLLDEAQTPGGD